MPITKARPKKVPVTLDAALQRINRRLAGEQQSLRITRDRWRSNLGDFYLLDLTRNVVVASHVNPEELGRELGVLEPWESVS